MEAKDFWERVENSIRENKTGTPTMDREGIGWFIGDMEQLFEEWD